MRGLTGQQIWSQEWNKVANGGQKGMPPKSAESNVACAGIGISGAICLSRVPSSSQNRVHFHMDLCPK